MILDESSFFLCVRGVGQRKEGDRKRKNKVLAMRPLSSIADASVSKVISSFRSIYSVIIMIIKL